MRQIPKNIEDLLKRWSLMASGLRITHVVLGFVAVVSSLLVAAKINSLPSTTIEWLAFLAAVSVGLMTGFDLGTKANRVRRAWRMLMAAKIRYEEDSDFKIESLIEVYEKAEEIIGDVKEKIT